MGIAIILLAGVLIFFTTSKLLNWWIDSKHPKDEEDEDDKPISIELPRDPYRTAAEAPPSSTGSKLHLPLISPADLDRIRKALTLEQELLETAVKEELKPRKVEVYCKDCKHYNPHAFGLSRDCEFGELAKNPIQGEYRRRTNTFVKNKNYDCKDFTSKE